MKLLAALLAATPLVTGPGTAYYAGMPPERFRGPALVRMQVVPEAELYTACNSKPVSELRLLGCARKDWLGRPYIVVPDPCPRGEVEQTARVLCHELAHAARGWTASHEE